MMVCVSTRVEGQRPGQRAAPMNPDDRRDALIEVFVRLAHREGRKPTTSEIAQEAGVAEGTIFRVFPTKEVLEKEAVQAAFCPAPVRRRITAIDPEASLRDRLVDFTRIMQLRFTEVFGLMGALGLSQPPNRGPHQACYDAGRHLRGHADEEEHEAAHQPLLEAINQLLIHDEDHLVVPGSRPHPPHPAAHLLGQPPGHRRRAGADARGDRRHRPLRTRTSAQPHRERPVHRRAPRAARRRPAVARRRRGVAAVTNQLTLTPRESLAFPSDTTPPVAHRKAPTC